MILKKVKKVPQRKCIACQDRDSKKELIRIVKNKEGKIFLDQQEEPMEEEHMYVKALNV